MPDVGQVRQPTTSQGFAGTNAQARPNGAPAGQQDVLQLASESENAARRYTLKTNRDQSVRMQSWESKGNGAIYTRTDDANTRETKHEVIIPRGLAPDQWIIEGKNGPQGMQWQAYPASRPQEVRQVLIDPNNPKLQIPIGNQGNPTFLCFDPSTGDVSMGTPRQPQRDPFNPQGIQQFNYLVQTVHADGTESLRTHELIKDSNAWGMQRREIKYIEIENRGGGQVTAYQVTNQKTGFFPETWRRQRLEVAVRPDGSYDVRGSDFSAHVPQGASLSKNNLPPLHIDTFTSNPQRLAMIAAAAGPMVAAGVFAATPGGSGQPASPPAQPAAAQPAGGTWQAPNAAAAPPPSMGDAPPPPGAFAAASTSSAAPSLADMPPPPLSVPNVAPGGLPGADAAKRLLATKQVQAQQLSELLQKATNADDPQVIAAQQQLQNLMTIEGPALDAISQGVTPQMAVQTLPALSAKVQETEAEVMKAGLTEKNQDDPRVQQLMQLAGQNSGLTALLVYAARQGALHVDTNGPDPGMAHLMSPQQAAADLTAKQTELEALHEELSKAQGQPPMEKVGRYQQLNFEISALDALSAGVTPRQAVAALKPTRDQLAACETSLQQLNPQGAQSDDPAVQQKLTEAVTLQARVESLESYIAYAAHHGALVL